MITLGIILCYLVSVYLSFLMTRQAMRYMGLDPEWMFVIFILIPVINLFFGAMGFVMGWFSEHPIPLASWLDRLFR